MSEVLQTTLSAERLRLLGARSPLGDEASAVLAREMERFAESRKDDRHYEMWSLIGFAGNGASETDRKTLMRYVSEYPQSQPRQVALLAMTTVGLSPELDEFCAGIAADSNRPLAERLLGCHRLKKQGRDDLLSTAAENEILRLWEESGEESMGDVIDIK
ncbi:MAG: hypothetical protein HYY18_06540 [Planctomycetes bacterium]|nr:hypothetical protein [Planctomycetota bacterium]